MRPFSKVVLSVLFVASFSLTAFGQSSKYGIGLRVGSQGIGADFSVGINEQFNVRVGGSGFSAGLPSTTIEDENVDVEFTGDATLFSASVLAEFFPLKNGLRLTAGATYNGTNASTTGNPTDPYSIRSRTFSKEQIGSLSADIEYGSTIQPYLGLGWGNAARGGRVGFLFDAGVLFSGAPEVSLSGSGMIEPTAAENQEIIQDALDGIKIYPVVSLGLSVRL